MKEEKAVQERFNLVQKGLATLAERVECLEGRLEEMNELKNEIKGLKLFMSRVHPEFKAQLPDIVKKLSGKL